MSAVTAVVCDFGGVLTTPLEGAFQGFAQDTGISLEELGTALAAVGTRLGANPIFELETARLSEVEFVRLLNEQLTIACNRRIELTTFGEAFFEHLHPNEPMIALMGELRGRGYRMGLCTNNVREWEPLWRAMAPVEQLFEVIVDSAIVGCRKPDPEIYALTLERLGVAPEDVLFVDDMDINCEAARAAGMRAVQFVANEQAIPEIEAALAGEPATAAD